MNPAIKSRLALGAIPFSIFLVLSCSFSQARAKAMTPALAQGLNGQ